MRGAGWQGRLYRPFRVERARGPVVLFLLVALCVFALRLDVTRLRFTERTIASTRDCGTRKSSAVSSIEGYGVVISAGPRMEASLRVYTDT